MIIAVASEKEKITEHFGHCQNFNIYHIEDNKIVKEESVPNPGHKPGFLPRFLHEKGVTVLMSGGIGQGAVDIFNELGVKVVAGVQGDSRSAVLCYIDGTLNASGRVCDEHNQ